MHMDGARVERLLAVQNQLDAIRRDAEKNAARK